MSSAAEYIPDQAEGSQVLPNAPEAEDAVLASLLLAPTKAPEAIQRFGTDEVFFDLRRQIVWGVMVFLWTEKKTFDAISVYEELKSRDQVEQIGLQYLTTLPDKVPSAENLPLYLDIVWEKYVARQLFKRNVEQIEALRTYNGVGEAFLVQVEQAHEQWKKLVARGTVTPSNLCEPSQFADAYYDAWFGRAEETFGWPLPFGFPFRFRPSEMTLMTGDNGSGKSSMLGLISVVVGKEFRAGEKVVIASMEVPPEITLWIMARQVLGVGRLEKTHENEMRIGRTLNWLQNRVLLYNFLGITDWRELLRTFEYARAHRNGVLFIVDSVMRIGIPDDDYAQQGFAAAQFADFCVKTGAHTILVVHENKGDGRAKDRVRGSKQWTDNAHNVVGMKRNEAKAERMEEWKQKLSSGMMEQKEFYEHIEKSRKEWDAKFLLSKQRFPGSQQNASRWLYFHRESLQFHEKAGEAAIDFTLD